MDKKLIHKQPFITLINSDGVAGLSEIKNNTVKCILTDPPYLYLKGQKLEREFDEYLYFSKCKRVLMDDGFIVLFGRGKSFYRWNTILSEMGFKFKEEIIWNKMRTTSPVTPIGRVHETISIFTKKNGKLNICRVAFFEHTKFDSEKVLRVIERIKTSFGNRKTFDLLKRYYENGEKEYKKSIDGHCVTRSKGSTKSLDRTLEFAVSLEEGMKEQSIIKEVWDNDTIHPTQKPVSILKRLLNLTTNKGDLVIDTFAGSCSTGIAASQLEREFIGWEIDEEYFLKAVERVKKNNVQLTMF